MAKVVGIEVGNGLYTPYVGIDKRQDPVGTFSSIGSAVGDASGGTMTINLHMSTQEFGFRPLLVLSLVTVLDNLATPEQVEFGPVGTGNRRLAGAIGVSSLGIASASGNIANFQGGQLAVPIEPNLNQLNIIVAATIWSSNVDTKAYQVIIFGLMYDLEKIAREVAVRPSDIFFGVR